MIREKVFPSSVGYSFSSCMFLMVLLVLLLLFVCYVSLSDICIAVWYKCASVM